MIIIGKREYIREADFLDRRRPRSWPPAMATGFRLGMALLCSSLAAAFDAALVALPRRASASLLLRRRLLAPSREGRTAAVAQLRSLR